MHREIVVGNKFALLLLSCILSTALASALAQQTPVSASASKPPTASDDGEVVFEQHCSRCHAAPQSFSPRIAGTVVRHMRVRASLTAEEERKLLRFFNP